jgi:hypothetical protein
LTVGLEEPGIGSGGGGKAAFITAKMTMFVTVEIGNPVFVIEMPVLARGF